jgi:hypothetical protein
LIEIAPKARSFAVGIRPGTVDFFGMICGFGMGRIYSAEILNSPAWRGGIGRPAGEWLRVD